MSRYTSFINEWSDTKPDKEKAEKLGLQFYYGSVCKRGHKEGIRRTNGGECYICGVENTKTAKHKKRYGKFQRDYLSKIENLRFERELNKLQNT